MIATKHLVRVTWVEELALFLSLFDCKVQALSTIFHILSLMLILQNSKEQILFHVSAHTHLLNEFLVSTKNQISNFIPG